MSILGKPLTRPAVLGLAAASVVPLLGRRASARDGGTTIRWGRFPVYSPVYIAARAGFFQREGVDFEFVGSFSSGPAVVQAAGVGAIDAGHSAISGIVNAAAAGIGVVGVADSQTEYHAAPLMQWYVLDSNPIRTASDAKGKRIGINARSGSFFYTALEYLRRAGLSKDDVEFVMIAHEHQEQALRRGQIDIASLIDPYSIALQNGGGVHTLFRAVDILGERQFSHVFFTKSFLENNSSAVRAFLSGYRSAIAFIYRNPSEAAGIMAAELGLSHRVLVQHRYTPHANVVTADVAFWMRLMREAGELADGGRLSGADVATTRFNIG